MKRLVIAAAALGATAVLAAACGTAPPSGALDHNPSPEPTATATAAPDGKEFEPFMDAVSGMIDGYWATALPAELDFDWQPLAGVQAYDPSAPPTCGGQPLEAQNAFYCPADDTISFDHAFLEGFFDEVGDAAPALILAHEYGHAVGQRLGGDGDNSFVSEALADCRAGAFMAEMARQGALEPGDDDEIGYILVQLGDDSPDRHTSQSGHGSAEERIAAYQIGFDGGPAACTMGGV